MSEQTPVEYLERRRQVALRNALLIVVAVIVIFGIIAMQVPLELI